MSREQILNFISKMSCSQGFYGRLLRDMEEDDSFLDELVNHKFAQPVDLVMYLEG
jgi:hypothetical protein